MPDAAPLAALPERSSLAGHILALDGVRGVAILLVLAFHFIAHGPGSIAWPERLADTARWGWVGVDLFFVLSGFLITRILLNLRGRPGAMRVFYARRALRIFPLYYAVLLAVGAYVLVQSRFAPTRSEAFNLAAVATYLTNFNVAAQDWGVAVFRSLQLTHLWTLAIEEQFYLLWPLVVLWLPRRVGLVACLTLIAGAPILRSVLLAHDASPVGVYVLTPCRADALAWGALLAYVEVLRPSMLRALGIGLLIAGVAVLLTAIPNLLSESTFIWYGDGEYWPPMQQKGFSAVAAIAAGFVAICAARALPGPLNAVVIARPLVLLGRYSYGIYLFHLPLRGVASELWRRQGYDPAAARLWPAAVYDSQPPGQPLSFLQASATVLALTAASVLMAWVSFHLFEQRFLRRKPDVPTGRGFDVADTFGSPTAGLQR